jgi:hypothetical protein
MRGGVLWAVAAMTVPSDVSRHVRACEGPCRWGLPLAVGGRARVFEIGITRPSGNPRPGCVLPDRRAAAPSMPVGVRAAEARSMPTKHGCGRPKVSGEAQLPATAREDGPRSATRPARFAEVWSWLGAAVDRLAGSVGADEAGNYPSRDVQRESVDRHPVAETLAQAVHRDRRCGHASTLPDRCRRVVGWGAAFHVRNRAWSGSLRCDAGPASEPATSVRRVTAKHRAVLSALRDAQHAHGGEPVSAARIAAVCSGPWHRRSDLVTQALWLLRARGLVLPSAGAAGGWKITATGRAELPPRRGPARGRPLIGGARRGPTRPR